MALRIFARLLEVVAGTMLVVATWAAARNPSGALGSNHVVLGFLADQSTFVLPLCGGLAYLGQLIRNGVTKASGKELARGLMVALGLTVFASPPGSAHHHRATLFRHRRPLRKLLKQHLCIAARSTSRGRTTACFLADVSKPDSAEGVAGKCWREKDAVAVAGLPDLNSAPHDPSEWSEEIKRAVSAYAKETNVSVDWVKGRMREPGKFLARSYYAVHIEQDDEIWGVVVLDSISPDGIDAEIVSTAVPLVVRTLQRAIEKEIL